MDAGTSGRGCAAPWSMYGMLLWQAHVQERATEPPAHTTEEVAARLAATRSRLSAGRRIEASAPVEDMIAYDLALIEACDVLGVQQSLLQRPDAESRAAVEASLLAAGFDARRAFAPGAASQDGSG